MMRCAWRSIRSGGAVALLALVACYENPTGPDEPSEELQLEAALSHSPYVDQHQTLTGPTPFRVGGSSDQVLAQVVKAGRTGQLWLITMPLGCAPGTKLQVELWKVVGDTPAYGPVYTQTFSGGGIEGGIGWRKLYLSRRIGIRRGLRFAIVLRTETGYCSALAGPPGDSYAGGDAWFDARPNPPGVWVRLDNGNPSNPADLAFETYVR